MALKQKEVGTETCLDCDDLLVLGDNWTIGRRDNYSYVCSPCCRKRSKLRDSDYHLYRNWGLRERDYQAILKSQGGGCAICGIEEGWRRFAVDHVHGKEPLDIRGLLCHNCNTGIGSFMDNTDSLENAINYLKSDYHKMRAA